MRIPFHVLSGGAIHSAIWNGPSDPELGPPTPAFVLLSPLTPQINMEISRQLEPRDYTAYETERMRSLQGVQLASFLLRACALGIDMIAALLVLLVLVATIVIPVSNLAGGKGS